MTTTERRTIRRYAHELYPHPGEHEIRPLAVEVPHLYAQAVGLNIYGTDWFDLIPNYGDLGATLAIQRLLALTQSRSIALFADAVNQGMTGDVAWRWADERHDEDGEQVYARAVHYGVQCDYIKPDPVLTEPKYHHHRVSTGNAVGRGSTTRVNVRESDCEACTEPVRTATRGEH